MLTLKQLEPLLSQAFSDFSLSLPKIKSGKVRESYTLPSGQRLLVTTDRFSAFNQVLGAFPYKGQVLNELSNWWFQQLADIIPNPILSVPDPNAMVMLEAQAYPVEVIVRGYITGVTSTSLWHLYASGERTIYGYHFPEGLQKNQILPEPIVTPTTKGEPEGRDEQLSLKEVVDRRLISHEDWEQIQKIALALFKKGQELAKQAGLLLVDTKYEFGCTKEQGIILIDEVHTPDSSRFWHLANYRQRIEEGLEPENFDKEFIRLSYTERGYQGLGEPPVLPSTFWLEASQRYLEIYERLTGTPFQPGKYPVQLRLQRNLQQAGLL